MRYVNIEDNFQPETALELALLDRIYELRRVIWDLNANPAAPLNDPNRNPPQKIAVITPTLRLASMVSVEENPTPHTLRIRAESFGPEEGSYGFAEYVPKEELLKADKRAAMRNLDYMVTRARRQIANMIKEGALR